jgi:ribosomal protein L22
MKFSNMMAMKQSDTSFEKPKLKINRNGLTIQNSDNQSSINKQPRYLPQYDIPFCVFYKTALEKQNELKATKFTKIVSKELNHSAYKLNRYCRLIVGKNVSTAISILDNLNAKGAKFLKAELNKFYERMKKVHKEKIERGLNVNFVDFKVSFAHVGKKLGMSMPLYRAKGKINFTTQSLSKFYLSLERVKGCDFVKNSMLGKTDFFYAHYFRKYPFSNNASLNVLRNYSFITTSKGRYYRKQQIKRLALFLRRKFYKERGVLLSYSLILQNLTENLGLRLRQLGPFYVSQAKVPKLTQKQKLTQELNVQMAQSLEILPKPALDRGKDTKKLNKLVEDKKVTPKITLQSREKMFQDKYKKL